MLVKGGPAILLWITDTHILCHNDNQLNHAWWMRRVKCQFKLAHVQYDCKHTLILLWDERSHISQGYIIDTYKTPTTFQVILMYPECMGKWITATNLEQMILQPNKLKHVYILWSLRQLHLLVQSCISDLVMPITLIEWLPANLQITSWLQD